MGSQPGIMAREDKISMPNLKDPPILLTSSHQSVTSNYNKEKFDTSSFRSFQHIRPSTSYSADTPEALLNENSAKSSVIWNDFQKTTTEILQIVAQKKLCVVRKLGSQVDTMVILYFSILKLKSNILGLVKLKIFFKNFYN